MGEKLKDLTRRQMLESLTIDQLKTLARDWWGLKPPYTTGVRGIYEKKLTTKKDFVSLLLSKIYTKKVLITAIKKQSRVTTVQKRRLERLVNHRCEACRKPLGLTPDVHHITPRNEGGSNADSNLIVLCPNCHRKAHSEAYTRKRLKEFIRKRK